MEWYFASDGDDLVVPKDREQLDRLPSPNSWMDWGTSEFPTKEFIGRSFSEEIDISVSGHEMECSSNPSMSYGLQNCLHQWAGLANRGPEYQLSELARMDQMDDNYFNSLLDEDLATDNLYGTSGWSTESKYSMMSAANLFKDRVLESELTPIHANGFGGSNNLKEHTYSTTEVWNRKAADSFPSRKALVLKDPVTSEHANEGEDVHEQTSTEESVLQELEKVTAKLTMRTRNCFRDSLYRLAENSKKQTLNPDQYVLLVENHSDDSVHDDTYRYEENEARESKTNAIDRAIANLMFTKTDFSAEDSHVSESFNSSKAANYQYCLSEPWASSCTMLAGDAEVPIVEK